jgi:citrate synthase
LTNRSVIATIVVVTTYVSAAEAARLLGVTKPTLYAYVSRGIVARRTAADGRTSLYVRDEVEQLAGRRRGGRRRDHATIDVEIASGITDLQDEGVSYRGHDAALLARSASFEQTAELLWTGQLPDRAPHWPLDRAGLARCRSAIDAAGDLEPIGRLTLATAILANAPGDDDAAGAARRLLAMAPTLLGGPIGGDVAARLGRAWRGRPTPELMTAITRALVLLADHELATSTLAVRVACSVRANPYAAFAAGLHVTSGPLHGAASAHVVELLTEAESGGARQAVARCRTGGRRVPGFGHSVYRSGDPRTQPLLDAVRRLPDRHQRVDVVDAVLWEVSRTVGKHPNVDLALGALMFVGELPPNCPLFAVARIAGWAAHYDEEISERPVRYRGLSTRRT